MNAYFMYRVSRLQRFFRPLRFSFCELLGLTREFQCQDKRDNIFGLLGLPTTDEVRLSIKPDYAKSLDHVYSDLVSAMIVTNPTSLAFLSFVHRGIGSTISNPALPSWVPRWAGDGPQTLAPLEAHSEFVAGLPQPAEFYLVDPQTLAVRGLIVPNEVVIGTNFPDGLTTRKPNRWNSVYERNPQDLRKDLTDILVHVYYSGRDLEQLAMTLVAGKGWYGTPVESRESALADFADALIGGRLFWALERGAFGTQDVTDGCDSKEPSSQKRKLVLGSVPAGKCHGEPEEDDPADNFVLTAEDLEHLAEGGNGNLAVDAVATTCAGRLLFTTAMGKRGVGPVSMRPGDQVCVIYGTPTPFIIRNYGTGLGRELDYTLVGECYIDDFMHGEALEGVTTSNRGSSWIDLV